MIIFVGKSYQIEWFRDRIEKIINENYIGIKYN